MTGAPCADASFYTLVGLGSMAFTYNIILQALSLVACLIVIFFLDKVGRRPFLVVGSFLQVRPGPLLSLRLSRHRPDSPTRAHTD